MEDKAKGRMKEAARAVTGDEDKKAEGRAQQRKGAAGEEAAQRAKTRQTEKEADMSPVRSRVLDRGYAGYELPRIPLLRRSVNKGKMKGPGASRGPRPG